MVRFLVSVASASVILAVSFANAQESFVSIVLPDPESEAYDPIIAGAMRAAADLGVGVKRIPLPNPANGKSNISFFKDVFAENPSGVITTDSMYSDLKSQWKGASELHNFVVIGPRQGEGAQSPSVTTNNEIAGMTAADFLGKRDAFGGATIAWIGPEDNPLGAVSKRIDGFLAQGKQYPGLNIIGSAKALDVNSAYLVTKELIKQQSDLKWIFATTSEATVGAGMALSKSDKGKSIDLVGIGVNSEINTLLDKGVVTAVIAANYESIGYAAVEVAVNKITGATLPDPLLVKPTLILVTKRFMEGHDYPPISTAAYGIVAFPHGSTPGEKERMISICESYYETFPPSTEVRTALAQQMVTVWPIDSADSLIQLSRKKSAIAACELAVEHYNLTTSLTAIKEAESTTQGLKLDGDGPFLLAWAPSTEKGKKDTLVLVVDLSHATNETQFLGYFRQWSKDIEQNPALWNNGWTLEKIRLAIRDWADKTGTMLLPHGLVTKE